MKVKNYLLSIITAVLLIGLFGGGSAYEMTLEVGENSGTCADNTLFLDSVVDNSCVVRVGDSIPETLFEGDSITLNGLSVIANNINSDQRATLSVDGVITTFYQGKTKKVDTDEIKLEKVYPGSKSCEIVFNSVMYMVGADDPKDIDGVEVKVIKLFSEADYTVDFDIGYGTHLMSGYSGDGVRLMGVNGDDTVDVDVDGATRTISKCTVANVGNKEITLNVVNYADVENDRSAVLDIKETDIEATYATKSESITSNSTIGIVAVLLVAMIGGYWFYKKK